MKIGLISKRLVMALLASVLMVPASAPAQASTFDYSSQGQVISPVAIWLPANATVPKQGTQISMSFEIPNYNGTNSPNASQYTARPTVSYVIADFAYESYVGMGFGTVAQDGDLGFLLMMDFGNTQDFTGPFQLFVLFDEAATSYDAAGVEGVWSWEAGGEYGIWLPATANYSAATFVVDHWEFQTPKSISAVVDNVQYVCPNAVITNPSNCASVSGQTGTVLKFSNVNSTDISILSSPAFRNGFIGVSGLSALMQTAITSAVAAPPRDSSADLTPAPVLPYHGPRALAGVIKPVKLGGELTIQGKGMQEVVRAEAVLPNGAGTQALEFRVGEEGLSLAVPNNLKPGVYDLVLTTRTYGAHTIIGGLVVRESMIDEFVYHMKSGWVDSEAQAAIKAFAAGKTSMAKKIHCMVNGPARAADLALNACDVVKQTEPTAAEMVTSTKDTYSKTGVWLKIWISY